MPDRSSVVALVAAVVVAWTVVVHAEPLLSVTPDGATLLYRARPGDSPVAVAQMFAIPAEEMPAFLKENGITDATRIGVGFVYRVPNRPVRATGARLAELESERERLVRELKQTREETRRLAREGEDARRGAELAGEKASRFARLASLWPIVQTGLVLLGLVTAGMGALASAAVRRQRQAERRARALSQEVDDKRRAALAERQEAARRVLDLEERIRTLEAQLGPRVIVRR